MIFKYCCNFIKNKINDDNNNYVNKDLDTSFHFKSFKEDVISINNVINQKIEHYVVFNEKEMEYIKNLEKNDLYNIICLFNKNNSKY